MSSIAFAASFVSLAEGEWADDSPNCSRCTTAFSWICRRHHCRKCGQNVCQNCSPNKVQVDGYESPQRVCTACVISGLTLGRESNTPNCSRCNASFAWNIWRHHCRKCGRCVCDGCSPNKVQIDDYSGPQRVCTTCVTSPGEAEAPSPPTSFEPLERAADLGQRSRCSSEPSHRHPAEPEADVARVQEFLVDFADRLRKLVKPQASVQSFSMASAASVPSSNPSDVEQAMACCEQFLSPLAKALKQIDELQHRDKAAEDREKAFRAMSGRLRKLTTVAARMCSQPEGTNQEPSSDVGTLETCEASLSLLEDVVMPQVRRRIENAESLLDGVPIPNPTRSLSFSSNLTNEKENWQQGTECTLCETKLGKRYLKPRHHCRSCARCVCQKCSESSVKVNGEKVRICDSCATRAFSECATFSSPSAVEA